MELGDQNSAGAEDKAGQKLNGGVNEVMEVPKEKQLGIATRNKRSFINFLCGVFQFGVHLLLV